MKSVLKFGILAVALICTAGAFAGDLVAIKGGKQEKAKAMKDPPGDDDSCCPRVKKKVECEEVVTPCPPCCPEADCCGQNPCYPKCEPKPCGPKCDMPCDGNNGKKMHRKGQ